MKNLTLKLATCCAFWAAAIPAEALEPEVPPADVVGAIRERLGDFVRDPTSAEIVITRGPRLVDIPTELGPLNGYAVCATINGKNGYGAYVGREPWMFIWFRKDGQSYVSAIQIRRSISVSPRVLADECAVPAPAE